jgi:diketogulonate reductase-like aldo/keto reductase
MAEGYVTLNDGNLMPTFGLGVYQTAPGEYILNVSYIILILLFFVLCCALNEMIEYQVMNKKM